MVISLGASNAFLFQSLFIVLSFFNFPAAFFNFLAFPATTRHFLSSILRLLSSIFWLFQQPLVTFFNIPVSFNFLAFPATTRHFLSSIFRFRSSIFWLFQRPLITHHCHLTFSLPTNPFASFFQQPF